MNEREILQNSIKDHQAAIDTAEKKLAELDKPKLRHGDYGYGTHPTELNIALLDNQRPVYPGLKLFDQDGVLASLDPQREIKAKLGNIFDDLKRNSEDLEEFTKMVRGGGVLVMSRDDFAKEPGIQFCVNKTQTASATFNEAIEIHQKLGQIIATIKRKGEK